MQSRSYLGVDGGGTTTALCLVADDGRVLAQLEAPSVYYFSDGISLVTEVLTPAVAEVCRLAGLTPVDLDSAFFGLPGYGESSADLPALDAAPRTVLGHDRYRCDNDMVCGWAGSLGAVDGINVISGTGSMTYGERAGRGLRIGGWGELFGDEGSAYWIAVRGLNAFSRMVDGLLPAGPLVEVLREHLQLTADLDLVDVVLNRWGGRRGEIAGLCRQVVEAADRGDEVAGAILDDAARELADIVAVTRQRLGFGDEEDVPVSWSGGTFNAVRVRDGFRREVLTRHPHTDLRRPLLPPAAGAALYAARVAGTPLGADAVQRLVRSLAGPATAAPVEDESRPLPHPVHPDATVV